MQLTYSLDLVRLGQLKHWPQYSGVPALHSAVEIAIKCPSGLLFAYFLAPSLSRKLFHHHPLPSARSWRRGLRCAQR